MKKSTFKKYVFPTILLVFTIIIALILGGIISLFVYETFIIGKKAYNPIPAAKYTSRILKLTNENETVAVKDVFDFEFEKAYVVKELYSGQDQLETLFNIEMTERDAADIPDDSIQQIIFIDSNGEFVFNYIVKTNQLIVADLGYIIYPDTKIRQVKTYPDGCLVIEFLGIKPEDYY